MAWSPAPAPFSASPARRLAADAENFTSVYVATEQSANEFVTPAVILEVVTRGLDAAGNSFSWTLPAMVQGNANDQTPAVHDELVEKVRAKFFGGGDVTFAAAKAAITSAMAAGRISTCSDMMEEGAI